MLAEGDPECPPCNKWLDRLTEGVRLHICLSELKTRGRVEDWKTFRSKQQQLDEICLVLSSTPEVQLKDYNRLRANMNARRTYLQAVHDWIANMETIKNEYLSVSTTFPSSPLQDLSMRVFDFERQFGRHVDISPLGQAREPRGGMITAPFSRSREVGTSSSVTRSSATGDSEYEESEIRESLPSGWTDWGNASSNNVSSLDASTRTEHRATHGARNDPLGGVETVIQKSRTSNTPVSSQRVGRRLFLDTKAAGRMIRAAIGPTILIKPRMSRLHETTSRTDVPDARCSPRTSMSAPHATDMTSAVQQRSAFAPESWGSDRSRQAPGHHNSHNELMKRLSNAGRGYQETLQKMKEYEVSRVKYVAKMDRLGVKATAAIDHARSFQDLRTQARSNPHRLASIDTSSYPEDILAILGSDQVANIIDAECAATSEYIYCLGLLEVIPTLEAYGNVWEKLGPTLAIVDAVERKGRVAQCTTSPRTGLETGNSIPC